MRYWSLLASMLAPLSVIACGGNSEVAKSADEADASQRAAERADDAADKAEDKAEHAEDKAEDAADETR